MNPEAPAFLLQIDIWEMVGRGGPLTIAVLAILLFFSGFSWTIIFSKWNVLRSARAADRRFLRAFRKASGLDAVMVASEQFKPAPLVSVFEFGYEEVHRQVKARGSVVNKISLERSLQLGTSEELTKLERNMSWLATTASVSPFIGLFGTVLGIIRAFKDLSGSMRQASSAVMAGVAEALVATAVGLLVAIPAVVMFNYFKGRVRRAMNNAQLLSRVLLAHLKSMA